MKEEKTATAKNSAGKENEHAVENGKKKSKEERPATKVVVRRLPPSMTEEQFKMQVSPLPDIDYFYYVPADMSLMPNAFCRAYINFVDQSDLFIFTQKFDGYVFVDSKGGEFPAVVEFAPFQRIPKNRPNRKKDPKMGTIETDPVFIVFKERLEAQNLENKTTGNASKQHFFETSLVPEKKEASTTPLLDFIKNRRAERQRIRDEKREEKRKKDLERRRAKEEQRRTKKDDDTSVVKVLNHQNTNKERSKEKDIKQSFIKKKTDEVKPTVKEKSSSDSRPKESKTRTGKSYLEERQRQAERREEQRKKLSQSQSSSSVVEAKSSISEDKTVDKEDKPKPCDDKAPGNETKVKDTDFKKPERVFKREEVRRNSYKYDKYENKRDRENDETRKSRRATNTERSHQSSRRDDERSEDGGRKRYSESRRNYDSAQRDRYKDKNKSKAYGQKKNVESSEVDTITGTAEGSVKSSGSNEVIHENPEKEQSIAKESNREILENELDEKTNSNMKESSNEAAEFSTELRAKSKPFESKDKTRPTRRKSLDYEKSRSSSTYSSSKSYSREKYSEKQRRNSVGSSKYNQERSELNTDQDYTEFSGNKTKGLSKKSKSKEKLQMEEKPLTSYRLHSEVPDNSSTAAKNSEFEEKEREIPKRRNSTGERPEKTPPRRNSLGSEDKTQVCTFTEHKFDSEVMSDGDKVRDDRKTHRSNRDPRTERRIRNKDRPSMEIYRPGMGRFSKQRLEREKGLGSSTEMESPSSSPSPTVSLH